MTEKFASFKSGRKPLSLQPASAVRTVTGILGAFAKASDEIVYPTGASSTEKDLIFCEKIGGLASGHPDLTSDNLHSTSDYLEASVKYFIDCRNAGDEAIERAGSLVERDLTKEEMSVFDSMDGMNADKLAEMKLVIDLLTAKLRASLESNDEVHPENSSNETMLMIVRHILKSSGVRKATSKFTARKRPAPAKSARYSMGVGLDSQQTEDYEIVHTDTSL